MTFLSGWFTFNVLGPVQHLIRKKGSHKRLEVMIEKGPMKVKTGDVTREVTPSGDLTEPHLLIYSEDERHSSARSKRSPKRRKMRNQQRRRRRKKRNSPCQLKQYHVDFKVFCPCTLLRWRFMISRFNSRHLLNFKAKNGCL